MIAYDKIIEDIISTLQDKLKLAKEMDKEMMSSNQFYFGMQEGLSFSIKTIKNAIKPIDNSETNLINELNDNTKKIINEVKNDCYIRNK